MVWGLRFGFESGFRKQVHPQPMSSRVLPASGTQASDRECRGGGGVGSLKSVPHDAESKSMPAAFIRRTYPELSCATILQKKQLVGGLSVCCS